MGAQVHGCCGCSLAVDERRGHGLTVVDVHAHPLDAPIVGSAAGSGEDANSMSLRGKLFGDGPSDGSGPGDYLEMWHDGLDSESVSTAL